MTARPVPTRPSAPPLRLLAIGSAAGIYSGLFGVGGGAIMVPLMILLLGFDARTATATSLAAICVIALAGAITGAIYGNVDWTAAGVIAVPAVVGGVLGASLQQRVDRRWLVGGLAILLIIGAIDLLIG